MDNMTIDEIKAHIRSLPDDAIGGLVEWLKEYYDGEVWDRQMEADIQRLSPEAWLEAVMAIPDQESERRKAALRLMNSIRFSSDADRDQCLRDFELLVGEALAEEDQEA